MRIVFICLRHKYLSHKSLRSYNISMGSQSIRISTGVGNRPRKWGGEFWCKSIQDNPPSLQKLNPLHF